MLEFLKKLIACKDKGLTIVVFDDQEPESSDTFQFRPGKLMYAFYGALALTVLLSLLVVMFTPVGALVYNREDEKMRETIIEIQQQVEGLRDSLAARDMQLAEIQHVLALGSDTTFDVNMEYQEPYFKPGEDNIFMPESFRTINTSGLITQNEIIFSGLLKNAPKFPAPFPVDGTLTRGFNTETGHFGIDIATKAGTPFKAIADGAVISQGWTVNYGYVLHIQHTGGLVSVYKHASSISKSNGDIVLKGDILGTTGDAGVLSSGPHLHIEIWKNGVPQNPISYLVNS
jgi:murein DD-endopeptidase MepM/ murein hydrolase activator NlpD